MYFADYAALRYGVVMYTLPLTGAPPSEPRRAIATPTLTPARFAQAVGRCDLLVPAQKQRSGYYTCVAPFFPPARPRNSQTSFRDSLRGGDGRKGNVSARNATFFRVQTWVTKVFYVFAKHFIGYFLNYARFLDRLDAAEIRHVHLMLVFSCFATTISMFLHTLKFKGYMGPRTAFLVYQASYLATFYSWYKLAPTVAKSPDLVAATLAGVAVNFMGRNAIRAYQAAVAVALFARRAGAV
ncbi:hypothetical protein JL721_3604 [Aureococcus anophagefferens]|nr:hypothetical protein JL721_3604 [Aureococcus anophagefferens]